VRSVREPHSWTEVLQDRAANALGGIFHEARCRLGFSSSAMRLSKWSFVTFRKRFHHVFRERPLLLGERLEEKGWRWLFPFRRLRLAHSAVQYTNPRYTVNGRTGSIRT
jgi:hypothetical protein